MPSNCDICTALSVGAAARRIAATVLLLLLTTMGSSAWSLDDAPVGQESMTESATARPRVSGAYVRAVPPGQQNSAAFMRILNPGDQSRALVAAESSVARVIELHTHARAEDGVMTMRRIEQIELPAKGEVALEPGGLHLMLIGLKKALAPGDKVDLHLVFDDGGAMDIAADTKAMMPAQGMHHEEKQHR